MTESPRSTRRAHRLALNLLLALVSTALTLVGVELVARVFGWAPFRPVAWSISVEPGGRYQTSDATLGYAPLPGRYRIRFGDGHTWHATHLPDSLRITRPLESYPGMRALPQVWLFGCSFVHGWGLDDEDTFAWRLQERLPDYEVRNFGVGGYGTLQSLLQFRAALGRGEVPRVAILAYADFHDERNTRLRSWRKATYEYQRFGSTAQPYVRLGPKGELVQHFDAATYRDMFFVRHSALLNRLDVAWSRIEDWFVQSHRVSHALVEQFDREARAHGVAFVLAGIHDGSGTREMLEFGRRHGMLVTDMSVDLGLPGNRMKFDGHPSPRANEDYARHLYRFLTQPGGLLERGAPVTGAPAASAQGPKGPISQVSWLISASPAAEGWKQSMEEMSSPVNSTGSASKKW